MFGEGECGNLNCVDYILSGNYWTVTSSAGRHEFYMQVGFSRPLDMPLLDATRLRYGFWIDDGEMGVEAFTCGWGYYPLDDDIFTCVSYKDDDNGMEYNYRDKTFHYFSDINLLRHYD